MSDKSKPYHYDAASRTMRLFFKTDAFMPPGECTGLTISLELQDDAEEFTEEEVLYIIRSAEENNPLKVGKLYSVSRKEYEENWGDKD